MPAAGDPPNRSLFGWYLAIAVVALIGLADAIYLTVQHVTGESVRCTIVSGCSEVLSSSYATVGNVPLALIGAVAYFTVFSLAILAAFGYPITDKLLAVVVGMMLVTSLWLTYLQAFVIGHYCQFCLLSAAVTTALAVLVAFTLRKHRSKKRL